MTDPSDGPSAAGRGELNRIGNGNYLCRPMARPELDLALAWAAEEGWNPGPHDAAAFWAADPGGFWLGELDGSPVASISVVRYGAEYGFLGCYIVRPEHRGGGLGLALWQRCNCSRVIS